MEGDGQTRDALPAAHLSCVNTGCTCTWNQPCTRAKLDSVLLAKHFQMKSHELILKPTGVKASKEDVLNTEMSHLSCIHTPDRNRMY
jgi:hypothetical protein